MRYVRGLIALVGAWLVGVAAYLAASTIQFGSLGGDWEAAPFWSGVSFAFVLPVFLLSIPILDRLCRSFPGLLVGLVAYAFVTIIPIMVFQLIWRGFDFTSTEGRLIGLLFLAACI
jgi:hypothetical protein